MIGAKLEVNMTESEKQKIAELSEMYEKAISMTLRQLSIIINSAVARNDHITLTHLQHTIGDMFKQASENINNVGWGEPSDVSLN